MKKARRPEGLNQAMLNKEKQIAPGALGQAAWQLEDAIAEKVCEKYPPQEEARVLFFEVIHGQSWYGKALWFMILLTIFETPTWCDTSHTWEFGDPQLRCLVYGDATAAYPKGQPIEVMLSGITYLPPGYSLIFEIIILSILARKLWLEYKLEVRFFRPLQKKDEDKVKEKPSKRKAKEDENNEGEEGPSEYFPLRKTYFCMSMIAIEMLDCWIFFFFRPKLRLAFLARTALFCMSPSVIKLYKCISKILVEVATVAVFFVGFLFFFAWVSVMIFNGYDHPPEHFANFGAAFYGLFVAGVCDEFTDILIESYTAYRWSGILWFVFLLVVHLLFLSLVLDTLCAGYMKSEEDEKEEVRKDKAKGVVRAFRLLSELSEPVGHKGVDKVSKKVFMAFLEEYIKSPSFAGTARVNKEYADIGYNFVDRDGDTFIDEKEFAELCALTQYSMWNTRKDSCLKESWPQAWDNPRVEMIRESVRDPEGAFEHIMTLVLSVNFVLVVIETTYDLNKWQEPIWTAWLEFVFSFVYLGECMFKIGVSGWDFYQSSTSNRFDFGTTMLLLSTSVFESLLGGLKTYANILRLFRLLRVVKQLKSMDRVQFMVSTVVKLVFKAQEMLILLSVVIFGFTVVGVQLFGGLLYEENPALEGTDYAEAKEFVLNFNDFLMAFGLWFVHLLCEFKPSFAEAINKTSDIPYCWLICFLYWAIAVCITFELVKAFTIEVYMDLKKKWDNKAKNGEQKPEVIEEIEKDFEARGLCFWWRCLAVDEGEYEEVQKEVEELLEEEEDEEESKEEERKSSERKGQRH